jgi:hypothetical protein
LIPHIIVPFDGTTFATTMATHINGVLVRGMTPTGHIIRAIFPKPIMAMDRIMVWVTADTQVTDGTAAIGTGRNLPP